MRERYYQWLVDFVCDTYHRKYYNKLLRYLYSCEFTWSMILDENRAVDGVEMREEFVDDTGLNRDNVMDSLEGPCTVFEMMVALANRCEVTIMEDPELGDRTGLWFWNMVISMGLYDQDDGNFDEQFVITTVDNMLERRYRRDGKGGLFTVDNRLDDLTKVDIWYQMLWYLNTIT